MTDYVMRLTSFYSHLPDVICSILGLPTLSQLIFPATLHLEIDNSLLISSSEQLDLSLLPQEFWDEQRLRFSLYGRNGVELYTHIEANLKNTPTPNVLGLRFLSEHIRENVISLAVLKSLFEEIVPIFQVDIGSVYDRKASRRVNPIYQHWRNAPKSKRYLQDSRGKQHLLEIHWINYFGKHILDSLGRERFTELRTYSEKYELHDGIMIILQNSPYDDDNYEHRQRQIQAEAELCFSSPE